MRNWIVSLISRLFSRGGGQVLSRPPAEESLALKLLHERAEIERQQQQE